MAGIKTCPTRGDRDGGFPYPPYGKGEGKGGGTTNSGLLVVCGIVFDDPVQNLIQGIPGGVSDQITKLC